LSLSSIFWKKSVVVMMFSLAATSTVVFYFWQFIDKFNAVQGLPNLAFNGIDILAAQPGLLLLFFRAQTAVSLFTGQFIDAVDQFSGNHRAPLS